MARRDRRNDQEEEAIEDDSGLRRVVTAPDGSRYVVVGRAKEWRWGTGSIALDVVAVLWGVVRRVRGKEWVVSVRAESESRPVAKRLVRTRGDAVSSVGELAEAVESGRLPRS
ncbi:MAG TPA: hypothetical protein VK969_12875 [Acidimicrobiia bacterium]|nr:hypothetical protein [Acidimicrobiia bacterium]